MSCRTFAANAVRLQLHALAYNLGNFLRTLATPEPIKNWSLTSLKEKLIKIGASCLSAHGLVARYQAAAVLRRAVLASSRVTSGSLAILFAISRASSIVKGAGSTQERIKAKSKRSSPETWAADRQVLSAPLERNAGSSVIGVANGTGASRQFVSKAARC